MKKNIGILFPDSKNGGVYQYALSIADSLINYCDKFDYTIFYHGEKPNLFFDEKKSQPNYSAIPSISFSPFKKFIQFFNLAIGGKFLIKNLSQTVKATKTDLLIVPTPFSYDIPIDIPFVASIPDYMHKYFPEFPECSFKDRLTRDIVYKYYGSRALLVVADSEQEVDDLNKFSGVKKGKVRIIPYIPPSYVYRYKNMEDKTAEDMLSAFNLPEKFIFYPGQFWFIKNHARLIKALNLIKEKHGVKIPLVLVGNNRGNPIFEKNYKEVSKLVDELNIKDQIFYLGYVGDKEMVALYKKSVALIAPPFQGPTTIPPLEAMVLGTPVATINLFELPKQVGNAGLFFDPYNIEDIADKTWKIWHDGKLRSNMIKAGYEKTKDMTPENYAKKWEQVINEAFKKHE